MIKRNNEQYIKIANQQIIKQNNLTLIFNLINQLEPVSRVKLAKLTHLSPTTISSLVEELISNDMVVEIGTGETYTSGRKPIMLMINKDSGYVISIELKSGKISGGIYDLKCNEIIYDSVIINDISSLGKDLIGFTENIILKAGLDKNSLLGITLGVPGIINHTDFSIVSSTVIDGLHTNKTFYSVLDKHYGVPVLMENESCFAAYAEHKIARNQTDEDIILIDINEGVGCGIIINHNIYKGSWGIAGELGHMVIDMNGNLCECGNRGCMETMVSIPAIIKSAIKNTYKNQSGVLWEIIRNDRVPDYNQIVEAFMKEDQAVTDAVFYAADCLAVGVNNVVNLFDIRTILVSGEITKIGNKFIARVKEKIRSIGFDLYVDKIDVSFSRLGENTVVLGGAKYMLDNIFESKPNFGML